MEVVRHQQSGTQTVGGGPSPSSLSLRHLGCPAEDCICGQKAPELPANTKIVTFSRHYRGRQYKFLRGTLLSRPMAAGTGRKQNTKIMTCSRHWQGGPAGAINLTSSKAPFFPGRWRPVLGDTMLMPNLCPRYPPFLADGGRYSAKPR